MSDLKLITLALEVGADIHWMNEGFLEGDNVAFVAKTFYDLAPSWTGTSQELAERILLLARER